jgi:hypothetical protein
VKFLLTATVTPRVAGPLHLTDPAIRREHYVESLRRWVPLAARYGATVVLVENSGEDLPDLAKDALGEVPAHLRLVSADLPAPEVVERGKGATEAAMMDLFCEQYFTDPAEVWFKCTGRLFVRNFAACVPAQLPRRPVVARIAVDLGYLDSRFFGTTAEIWRSHFTGAGAQVYEPDDIPIEKVLARRALSALGEGADLVRFTRQPAIIGRSGTHSDRIYDSPLKRVKRVATNQLENLLRGPLTGKLF